MKHFYPEAECIGINYGQPFPWDKIEKDETVFMVDFALQPFEDMLKLESLCCLTWIDHHKTAIEDAARLGFECDGVRTDGIAACELTWQYFVNGLPIPKDMPQSVRWLGRYDVWDHSDENVLPFQWGMRQYENTWPDNQALWEAFFSDNLTIQVKNDGRLILAYERAQNAKFCRAYAFETELLFDSSPPDCPIVSGSRFKAICCNRGFTNSQVFDSVFDPFKHDIMITFCRLKPPAHKWTVSLYSTKSEIDCGAIAKAFGGGGHKGAAGFQCEKLPFEI